MYRRRDIPPSFTGIQQTPSGTEMPNQWEKRRKDDAFRLNISQASSPLAIVAGLLGVCGAHARRATLVAISVLAVAWIFETVSTAAAPRRTPRPIQLCMPGLNLSSNPARNSHAAQSAIAGSRTTRSGMGTSKLLLRAWPYAVPDQAVLRMIRNPTTQAVVCYGYASFGLPASPGEVRSAPQDPIEIFCFIPEKPTS